METQQLKINIYECEKGHQTITRDCEEGVTPFMIECTHEGCDLMARSNFYQVDQNATPSYEWYKPSNYVGLHNDEIEHVKKGGLLMREIAN